MLGLRPGQSGSATTLKCRLAGMDFDKSRKQDCILTFISRHPQCFLPFHWKALLCCPELRWFVESISSLNAEKRFMRSVAALQGLKFVPAGEYKLLASIRSKGEELWQLQGEYPLLIHYLT